ncbi:hypothetical protein niasHS_012852 [Heterodera schachtii]|uniref:RNA-directed DNA polymerase n=1 Tax=Heterodera schachtii TaxID=97005 RepID=A0ABD2IDM3_HETSC
MTTKEELKAILDAQQKQFTDLLSTILSKNVPSNNSDLFSKINGQIPDFEYDPEADSTFALWYERFGPFIEKDGQVLDDDMKVRLVLGKLSPPDYIRFEQQILPGKASDLTFQECIGKLKTLFSDTKSIFVRRFECFQLACAPTQNVLDFGAIVNARCERAEMTLSKEEVKCMIFMSGLTDAHKDLRQECLRQLEKARAATPPQDIKLEKLLEECRAILSLKNSSAALANPGQAPVSQKCKRCGQPHAVRDCFYPVDVKCFGCGKLGHTRNICHSSAHPRVQSHVVSSTFSINGATKEWIWIPLEVNGHQIKLAADSCSHLSIIQLPVWQSLGEPRLEKVGKLVGSFSGHKLKLLGSFKCDVQFRGVTKRLELSVADTEAPSIMGLDWIIPFERATQQPIATTLEQQSLIVNSVQPTNDPVKLEGQIKASFPKVFQPGLGHCVKTKATLHLKQNVKPVFCRARPVPHGVQAAVDEELDRLLDSGVLKPIDFSRWAAPVLAVRKKSGNVRICIDFSTGLNDALELNRHPLPRTEDIFHALRGAKVFSQLDLRDAYLQVELDESSKQLVGINTHRGLFQYQRLPFGIKSAPSIFQKAMDQLTSGIPGVFAYLDDIIIASADHSQHVAALIELFSRIQDYGFRVQLDKCHFLKAELKFLGHVVSSDGLKPDPARSDAIRNMPSPHDIGTLRSFLGALNYYGRFIKEMRDLRTPLDLLLKKDTPWFWGPDQQKAFDQAKQVLQSDLLLTQYDPSLPIIVAADASQSGIGATISHVFPNGVERVIEHASRTLTPAERNYAQIEREALSLIFAADVLSRLISEHRTDEEVIVAHTSDNDEDSTEEVEYALLVNLEQLPVDAKEVSELTTSDDLLQQVAHFVRSGWPNKCPANELMPFYSRRDTLTLVGGSILTGNRVIVPAPLRQRVLKTLHFAHPGIVRMKALARNHVFWPGLDSDIEAMVKHCAECQFAAKMPPKAPLRPWPTPGEVFGRVHIDFAGPCADGNIYLIFVDALSKWPEVMQMRTTTAKGTIEALNLVFHRYGAPKEIVSDNGPPFTSHEFKDFCRLKGIKHKFSPPYQPHCNGQAERMVDTFKRQAKKNAKSKNQQWISEFLFAYRSSPSPILNGFSPAELFLGRTLRTPLSMLEPKQHAPNENDNRRGQYQAKMSQQYNHHHGTRSRSFKSGDSVLVLNYRRSGKPSWLEVRFRLIRIKPLRNNTFNQWHQFKMIKDLSMIVIKLLSVTTHPNPSNLLVRSDSARSQFAIRPANCHGRSFQKREMLDEQHDQCASIAILRLKPVFYGQVPLGLVQKAPGAFFRLNRPAQLPLRAGGPALFHGNDLSKHFRLRRHGAHSLPCKMLPIHARNNMINVHQLPFFGQNQSFMGKSLWDWFKKPRARFSDSIDRLNCHFVPVVLLFFMAMISANIFGFGGMEPIRCLEQHDQCASIAILRPKPVFYGQVPLGLVQKAPGAFFRLNRQAQLPLRAGGPALFHGNDLSKHFRLRRHGAHSLPCKMLPIHARNNMINVHQLPFFGQNQSFMGKSLWDWFKKPRARFSDSIDRLNCHFVPVVLLFFMAMISANIFGFGGMEPIRCLVRCSPFMRGRSLWDWFKKPRARFSDSIDRLNCHFVPVVLLFFMAMISANIFGFGGMEPIRCLVRCSPFMRGKSLWDWFKKPRARFSDSIDRLNCHFVPVVLLFFMAMISANIFGFGGMEPIRCLVRCSPFMRGKSLWDWFKKPRARFSDSIDRLNCHFVPVVLLFFMAMISANIFGFGGMEPIRCLVRCSPFMRGKSLWDWFKKPRARFSDSIDRLNCHFVPVVLLFFMAMISANIFGFGGMEPIRCLVRCSPFMRGKSLWDWFKKPRARFFRLNRPAQLPLRAGGPALFHGNDLSKHFRLRRHGAHSLPCKMLPIHARQVPLGLVQKAPGAFFSDSIDRLNCHFVPVVLLFFMAMISANIFGFGGMEPIRCLVRCSPFMRGKSLWDWFKKPRARFSDSIDRLNCHFVPVVLLFFMAMISANIFGFGGMEPIRCLVRCSPFMRVWVGEGRRRIPFTAPSPSLPNEEAMPNDDSSKHQISEMEDVIELDYDDMYAEEEVGRTGPRHEPNGGESHQGEGDGPRLRVQRHDSNGGKSHQGHGDGQRHRAPQQQRAPARYEQRRATRRAQRSRSRDNNRAPPLQKDQPRQKFNWAPVTPTAQHVAPPPIMATTRPQPTKGGTPVDALEGKKIITTKVVVIAEETTEALGYAINAFVTNCEDFSHSVLSGVNKAVILWTGTEAIRRGMPWANYVVKLSPIVENLINLDKRLVWICPPRMAHHAATWLEYEDGFCSLAMSEGGKGEDLVMPFTDSDVSDQGFLTGSGVTKTVDELERTLRGKKEERPSLDTWLQRFAEARTHQADDVNTNMLDVNTSEPLVVVAACTSAVHHPIEHLEEVQIAVPQAEEVPWTWATKRYSKASDGPHGTTRESTDRESSQHNGQTQTSRVLADETRTEQLPYNHLGTRQIMKIWHYLPMKRQRYEFTATNHEFCSREIPISLSLPDRKNGAYLDPVTLIITDSPSNGSCADYQSQTLLLEGQIVTVDQIIGDTIVTEESEVTKVEFGTTKSERNPALDPLIFHNLALFNDSDPTIQALAMFKAYRLGKQLQQEAHQARAEAAAWSPLPSIPSSSLGSLLQGYFTWDLLEWKEAIPWCAMNGRDEQRRSQDWNNHWRKQRGSWKNTDA